MIRVALADMRESWLAWAGVSLAFVATNFAFALGALAHATGAAAPPGAATDEETPELLASLSSLNLVLSLFVGLAVIGASTALVVSSRRGALARLLLAGADPGQLVRMLSTQLAVVSLASAVVGDALALALLRPTVHMIATDRGFREPPPVWSIGNVLVANLACVVVSVVGGLRQTRRASSIPPVEALRQSTGGVERRLGVGAAIMRLLGAAAAVGTYLGLGAFVTASMDHIPQKDRVMNMAQVSMLSLVLGGVALTCLAPLIVRPLTALWTRLLPLGPSWHLARNAVIARSDRLVRTVVPVMFAIGLLFGLTTFTASMIASIEAVIGKQQVGGTSATTVLSLVGLVLIIAAAGALGTLVMMSRQRDAELALAGLSGATPLQQALVPVFEGIILTVTGTILGLVMTLQCMIVFRQLEGALLPKVVVRIPWGLFATTFGVALAAICVAILAPTVGSLRRPAPRVIARLVAE